MANMHNRLRRLEAMAETLMPWLDTEDGGRVRVSQEEMLGAFVELMELEAYRTIGIMPEEPLEYEYLWPDLLQAVQGQSQLVDMMKAMAQRASA